jgi:MoxR-like ATPase
MAQIVFTQGPYAGHRLPLPDTGIILGRGEKANLSLDDPQISSTHAQLRIENGVWCLFDLQSSNGTTVNGHPIEAVQLNEGDVVAVGDTQFVFNADGGQAVAAPAAPPTTGQPAAAPAAPAVPQPQPEPAPQVPAVSPTAEPTPPQEVTPPARAEVVKEAPAIHVAAAKEEPKFSAEATEDDVNLVKQMSKLTDAIRAEVGKIIVGQREVLDQVLMCMIAGGHALLIGLPGLAKTLTVSTIAKVLDMKFKRVQFTPDLMPTDIIGADVLETNRETGEKEFRFIQGPIFCNLLLADEINRTPPKTQAALLEAMQEKRVTAGNTTYTLDKPFFVLATQNPIEQEGTYPLPEAQQDRFMFNIWVDYPLQDEEEKIISATTTGGLAEPRRILTKEQVLQLQSVVRKIPVSDHVIKYVVKLVRSTRYQYEEAPEVTKKYVSYGAGPRASQNLVLAAKAMAVLEGRIHVSCNDIRRAAIPVLRHRIGTNFAADSEGLKAVDIVKKLLEIVPEPGADAYSEPAKAAPAPAPAQAQAKVAKKKK